MTTISEATNPLGTVSEPMFGVTDIDAATGYWTGTVGLAIKQDARPAWIMLEDTVTQQRVILATPEDFGPFLSVEAFEFEAALEHVQASGGSVEARSTAGDDSPGFQWARCIDAFGVPLMVFRSA